MNRPNQPDEQAIREPSRFELLLDFVKVRFWSIIAIGFAIGAVALYLEVEPTIPRFWKIAGFAALIVAPYGWIVGRKVVDLLHNPAFVWVIDLDARETDGALYRFPYADYLTLDVENGEMCELNHSLYTAKDVDLSSGTCVGTWRGTASDPELLRSLQRVDELRGELEHDAMKGTALDAQKASIVKGALRDAVLHVVDTLEEGSLPDGGDGLKRRVDSALEQFDINSDLEDEVDVEDPEPRDEVSLEISRGAEPFDAAGFNEPEVQPADD